jgi:hypothetical protein
VVHQVQVYEGRVRSMPIEELLVKVDHRAMPRRQAMMA